MASHRMASHHTFCDREVETPSRGKAVRKKHETRTLIMTTLGHHPTFTLNPALNPWWQRRDCLHLRQRLKTACFLIEKEGRGTCPIPGSGPLLDSPITTSCASWPLLSDAISLPLVNTAAPACGKAGVSSVKSVLSCASRLAQGTRHDTPSPPGQELERHPAEAKYNLHVVLVRMYGSCSHTAVSKAHARYGYGLLSPFHGPSSRASMYDMRNLENLSKLESTVA